MKYRIPIKCAAVPLTKGYTALIDEADIPLVESHSWKVRDAGGCLYAVRNARLVRGSKRTTEILMHRVLMNPPQGMHVDHINGNGLDNRRSNLRVCTPAQNQHNSAPRKQGSKGVVRQRDGRYRAQICLSGKRYGLGMFDTKKEAAMAYDKKAIELFGEFARLNYPELVDVAAPARREEK